MAKKQAQPQNEEMTLEEARALRAARHVTVTKPLSTKAKTRSF